MRNIRLIIISIMLIILCLSGCAKTDTMEQIDSEDVIINLEPIKMVAVIKQINLENNQINFIGIDDGKEYTLGYSGGVDVTNRYGEIISATTLKLGQVVDVSYNASNYKLSEIHLNEESWEYSNESKLKVDVNNNVIRTASHEYKYDSNLLVFSDEEITGLAELCLEDEVTVRGYKGRLCSITVDYGHGYVLLTDYDTYIDGMIEIGYDVIVPVTESMLLTVREGDYKLQITKGNNTGYKNIQVVKNQQVEVSLKELQIEPASRGIIKFNILPEGARVYIDGDLIDQTLDYETIYGLHRIKIFADGYTSYSGYFRVSEAYKIREYSLVIESTDEITTEEDDIADSTLTNNKVTINGPIGAYLYVDGKYIGETPSSFLKTVGSHTITLTKVGYITKSYTITCIDNGQDDDYSYEELTLISDLVE